MIARTWRGTTTRDRADAYLAYLHKTGVKACRETPGNLGVYVLHRRLEGRAEFLFISLWESLEVIRRFAGPEVERAVYFPEDRGFLREMAPHVEHYEVSAAGPNDSRSESSLPAMLRGLL
jgi:heme-degrading monooxygenase HmoA